MTHSGVPIGVAAIRSGMKVPTIRYYEEIGLLVAPARTHSNRRNYGVDDLRRLVFIRRARELGFEIDAIRALSAFRTTRITHAKRSLPLRAPGLMRLNDGLRAW